MNRRLGVIQVFPRQKRTFKRINRNAISQSAFYSQFILFSGGLCYTTISAPILMVKATDRSFAKKKDLYAKKRVVDCLPQSKNAYDIKHVADWTPQIVSQRSILVATAFHNAVYSTLE